MTEFLLRTLGVFIGTILVLLPFGLWFWWRLRKYQQEADEARRKAEKAKQKAEEDFQWALAKSNEIQRKAEENLQKALREREEIEERVHRLREIWR